ncbi:uncharacterized protein LOC121868597 [Homarus americanus]|uniref:Monocarboxylate transporter 12-like 8 n=1 Tax=Homarus americanus TaxID=6706 RepID=A0A8J5MY32_HOMAM|nr:uncharacterized protein LOC121868597 [Homarus americanus]KAG7167254.1 Monocarboxylate transporter 12-like 8 [Homarus americanus]
MIMTMEKVASSPAMSTEGWSDEEVALSENEVAALNVALGMGMSVTANTEDVTERHTVADLSSIVPTSDRILSVARLQPVLETAETAESLSLLSGASDEPGESFTEKVASFYIGGDDGFSPREDKTSSSRRESVIGTRIVPVDGEKYGTAGKVMEFTPPDGGYGWVVAFSACFINMWIVGFMKSYGVLYVEIRSAFPEASAYHTSWVPSLLSTVGLITAPVTGTLCRRFTSRKVSVVGGLMCFLGLVLGSISTTMNQLILSLGLLTGMGAGFTTTPGILIVSLYFEKRRTFASAICVSGNALGGFFMPPLVNYLLVTYGLRGTLMLLGAMQLHICVASMLYRPISHHAIVQALEQQKLKEEEEETGQSVPKDKLLPTVPASPLPNPARDPTGSIPTTPLARSRALWQKVVRRRLSSTTSAKDEELQRQVSFLRSASMMNSIPDLTQYARSWAVTPDRSSLGSRSSMRTGVGLGSKSSLFNTTTSRLSLSKLPIFAEHPSVLRLSSEEDGKVTSVRLLRGNSRLLSQSRVAPGPDSRSQLARQTSIRTVQSRIMTSVIEAETEDKDIQVQPSTQSKDIVMEKEEATNDYSALREDEEKEVKSPSRCMMCCTFFDCALFKDPLFVILALSVFFMSCGAPFSLFFLPAYAETIDIPSSQVPTIMSISSIVDLCGRLGMGFVSDLGIFKMHHIYAVSGLMAATAVLLIPHISSYSWMSANLSMYGFGVGSWFVMVPPILAKHHGATHFASSYGLVRLFNGLMNFISPQFNGFLYDLTKDFRVLYSFMGSCMVFASFMVLILVPLVTHCKAVRATKQENDYIIKNPA